MKYLCTSETLFTTINKLNEGVGTVVVRDVGEIFGPAIKKEFPALYNSIKNYFFATPKPALRHYEKSVLDAQVKAPSNPTVPMEVTYPSEPWKAPLNPNPIVHAPPQEIGIPGRNTKLAKGTKGEIVPYRESKPKNAIEPYKFEKIKADTDPKPIVKPDPKPKVKEPKPKVKEPGPKFGFPFGGIDTPDRGAGSINEPASMSDLPLNLRVDSIGSYATRQRM